MSAPWIEFLNTQLPFFGLSIPGITYTMAGATILLGGGIGIWDFRQVKQLSKQMSTLVSELKKMHKPMTQDVIEQVQLLFENQISSIELKESWEEFKASLLTERSENGDLLYIKTIQAEKFFTGQFIFRTLPSITTALPGIATAIGLLGTFSALLCGLAELHVADAGAVEGIGIFINALSGKFFSSIAGLLTALLCTIYLNTIRKQHLDKKLHTLQHQLNVLIPHKSSEAILLELKKELVRIDRSVGHLANDMAQKLPDVIKDSLGGDMQSLLFSINSLGHATEALKEVNSTQLKETLIAVSAIRDGVDQLQSQNSDAITESIRGMMDEFKQGFHQSASTEMQQLADNLGQAAQFLQGMEARGQEDAERQRLADERIRQLMESMEVASHSQQEKVSNNTEQLNALLQQVVEQANQMNHQGQQSIQEQLQHLMSQTQQQGEAWRQQMQELVGQALGQFQNESQQQVEQLARQSGEMAQRLDSLLSRLDESGHQQQAHTQQTLSSMQAQLEGSALAHSQQVQEQQKAVNTAVEEALSRLATFMETRESGLQQAYQHLQSTQHALAETLSTGSQDLGQTVNGLKDTLSLTRQSMEQLNLGQKSLSGMVEALQNAQQSLVGGMKDSTLTASRYQQAIGAMQELHDRQSKVYGELESRLASILGNINTNMELYTNRTNQGLSQNLKEWDKHLQEASKVFSSAVVEVKDSADSLADAMNDLAKRVPQTSSSSAKASLNN